MPTTTKGLPYPSGSDNPNIPSDFQALAQAVDTELNDYSLTTHNHDSTYIASNIVNAKGDLVTATADNTPAILSVGATNGHVLTIDGTTATGLKWAAPTGAGSVPLSIIDAKGDLIVGSAADTAVRLGVGTDGQVLQANSATTSGLQWATISGGSGGGFVAQTSAPVDTGVLWLDTDEGATPGINPNIIDAKGDLIVGSAADTVIRFAAGTNGQYLTANSGTTSGLEWVTPSFATLSGTETLTNKTFTNYQVGVSTALTTTGTIALDFATEGFKSHSGNLTGNITYTASNYAAGRSITVRVPNGTTQRTLTFPSSWRFVGAKPANIAASKVGILTVTSFGTTEADCVAAWAVES